MPLSEKESKSDYLVLPLDVPPPPLFSDSLEQNIIPQVPLFELMNKFDGVTEKVTRGHAPGVNDSSKWPAFGLLALLSVCSLFVPPPALRPRNSAQEYNMAQDLLVKKFRLSKLPKYLIVHITRFTKNTFFIEKNPTVVTFPISNLVLRDYLDMDDTDEQMYKYDLVVSWSRDLFPGSGSGCCPRMYRLCRSRSRSC